MPPITAIPHAPKLKVVVMNQNLIDSIDYQKDTIVSKRLLKSGGGHVTLFAFSKGQELSEHSTPHHAMVQCLEGELEFTLNGDSTVMKPGDFIIMESNAPHAVKAVSDFKMLLTLMKRCEN